METTPTNLLLFVGGLGLAVIAATVLGRYYWSRRLTKWAAAQGYKLVDFRGAKFYEGPHAWRRSDNQHLFYVELEKQDGAQASAWVMFGTYWGFSLDLPLTEVIWESREE